MLQHWIFREPALCFGLPVYLSAAVLFPFYLGWTGTSLLSLAGYLLVAALLFSVADAVWQPSLYPKWKAIIPQSFLSLFALALPAAILFVVGGALGAVEERLEDEVCANGGAVETADASAEADDAFDVTADCALDR